MNDATVQVFMAIVGLLGTALTGFIAYKMAQLKNSSDLAAKAAELAGELAAKAAHHVHDAAVDFRKKNDANQIKLHKIEETTNKTLVHVNDAFLIQLRLYAESTRTIAVLTNRPGDNEKADAAEKMFREHEAKQIEAREDKNKIDAIKAKDGNSIP